MTSQQPDDCLGCCLGFEQRRKHDKGEAKSLRDVADKGRENQMTTTLIPDTNELREIAMLPTESALPRAARFLADLVKDTGFVETHILPLVSEAKDGQDWYVARQYDGDDGSYSLKIFVWPPGTGTRIHDHSSWGAYACATGTVLEERGGARSPEEGLATLVEPR